MLACLLLVAMSACSRAPVERGELVLQRGECNGFAYSLTVSEGHATSLLIITPSDMIHSVSFTDGVPIETGGLSKTMALQYHNVDSCLRGVIEFGDGIAPIERSCISQALRSGVCLGAG